MDRSTQRMLGAEPCVLIARRQMLRRSYVVRETCTFKLHPGAAASSPVDDSSDVSSVSLNHILCISYPVATIATLAMTVSVISTLKMRRTIAEWLIDPHKAAFEGAGTGFEPRQSGSSVYPKRPLYISCRRAACCLTTWVRSRLPTVPCTHTSLGDGRVHPLNMGTTHKINVVLAHQEG